MKKKILLSAVLVSILAVRGFQAAASRAARAFTWAWAGGVPDRHATATSVALRIVFTSHFLR